MTNAAAPPPGGCADCHRPVLAASDAGPRGAACGCDHTCRCERHDAHPSAPMYHRRCARRYLRRQLERIAAR
jgi:hypothetical protein